MDYIKISELTTAPVEVNPTDFVEISREISPGVFETYKKELTEGGFTITEITYAALLILYNAGTMVKGFYKITDRADAGIIIQAVSTSRLALNGIGLFLNTDKQVIGDYSGVVATTGIAYTTTVGVKVIANEMSYTVGQIVFAGNYHEQIVATSFTGPTYFALTKTLNHGYILESDYIEYDIINDLMLLRNDKRGNSVRSASIDVFRWGSNISIGNKIHGIFNNVDAIAESNHNYIDERVSVNLTGSYTKVNNNKFYSEKIDNSPAVINLTQIAFGSEFINGTIKVKENINFDDLDGNAASCYGYSLSEEGSTFPSYVSYLGLTSIDLGNTGTYIGIVNIIKDDGAGNASITITDFDNFPINRPIRIQPKGYPSGIGELTITFTHATGVNQPICSGGIDAVLNSANGDWIEFTKRETKTSSGIYRIYQTGGETY